MEQNLKKNANVSTSCMPRAERQMVSALTINYQLSVSMEMPSQACGNVDDILKYWSVQSSSNNNMPILCQLAELYESGVFQRSC